MEALEQDGAWCGLEFGDRWFRFRDVGEVQRTVSLLKEDNIKEYPDTLIGTLIGLLPEGRQFELRTGSDEVIRGRVGPQVENTGQLKHFLEQMVKVPVNVTQVGEHRRVT